MHDLSALIVGDRHSAISPITFIVRLTVELQDPLLVSLFGCITQFTQFSFSSILYFGLFTVHDITSCMPAVYIQTLLLISQSRCHGFGLVNFRIRTLSAKLSNNRLPATSIIQVFYLWQGHTVPLPGVVTVLQLCCHEANIV